MSVSAHGEAVDAGGVAVSAPEMQQNDAGTADLDSVAPAPLKLEVDSISTYALSVPRADSDTDTAAHMYGDDNGTERAMVNTRPCRGGFPTPTACGAPVGPFKGMSPNGLAVRTAQAVRTHRGRG
ncbi:hypothetical protein [Streptomyces sp. x-19]|uniref:hypothetical protein n=1 Tax=Streptomyces sp. x-19 TaxID=2789280 RepID=UPI00397F18F2